MGLFARANCQRCEQEYPAASLKRKYGKILCPDCIDAERQIRKIEQAAQAPRKQKSAEISAEQLEEMVTKVLQEKVGALQDQIKSIEQNVSILQETIVAEKGERVPLAVIDRILQNISLKTTTHPASSSTFSKQRRQAFPAGEEFPLSIVLPTRWNEVYAAAVGALLVQDPVWRAHVGIVLSGDVNPLFNAMLAAGGQGLRERVSRKRFLLALAAWGPPFWSSYAVAAGAFRWLGEDFAAATQDTIGIPIPPNGKTYLLDRWHANFTRLTRRWALDCITLDWGDVPQKGTRISPRQWQVVGALLRHANTPMTGDEIARDVLHHEWAEFDLPTQPPEDFNSDEETPLVEEWRGQLRDACARYANQRSFLGILPTGVERNRRYFLQTTFQQLELIPSKLFEGSQAEIFSRECNRHGIRLDEDRIVVPSLAGLET